MDRRSQRRTPTLDIVLVKIAHLRRDPPGCAAATTRRAPAAEKFQMKGPMQKPITMNCHAVIHETEMVIG